MTDPNNPLNLLLTLETALHKSHKGRWPNNVRNAVQGLRRALAARYETSAGPVYGSIDACCQVQRKFAWSAPIVTAVQDRGHYEIGGIGFQATGSPCPDCGAEAGQRCKDGCPGLL